MDFKEETIKTYSGLSTETKPTIAAGDDVPNGSRWREIDTDKKYFFNLSDDTWYEKIERVSITDGTNDVSVNSSGQMHVVLMGKVDTGNSSTTPLLADATFTGSAVDTLDYGYIFVTIFSNVNSATNGLLFQQSSDGTNWDNVDSYNYIANTGKTYSIQPATKWFRVVYTNGGSDQTAFRLNTVLKKTSSLASSHRISDNLSPEDDGALGISIIKGEKPDGDYTDFNATAGGNFKISIEELETGISSNSNSQLNTTLFAASGTEYTQDPGTGAFTMVDFAHHEIHQGDHFYNKDWIDLTNGQVYDMLLVTPNTDKLIHFLFTLDAEAEFNITLYGGTTTSADGTPMTVFNRNPTVGTANGMVLYHTPTVTSVGTALARYKGGAGKLVGGTASASNEVVLVKNTKYLARITNDTTSNNWINWLLDWYEHLSV